MGEEDRPKSSLAAVLYGFTSLKELSSLFSFLLMFAVIFLLDFIVIIKTFGLGAFLNKSTFFTPSLFSVISGEFIFVLSFILIIFLICILFYDKLYFPLFKREDIKSLVSGALRKFPKFLISTFMQGAVSFLGLIALVIPGVYYGSSLMFFNFFVLQGNSTVYSAFKNSRDLAKNMRLQSMFVFIIYTVVLLVFLYIVDVIKISLIYRAFIAAILMSYLIISYSNTSFRLADNNLNLVSGRQI